jgi:hypothetical protein
VRSQKFPIVGGEVNNHVPIGIFPIGLEIEKFSIGAYNKNLFLFFLRLSSILLFMCLIMKNQIWIFKIQQEKN